MKFGGIVCEDVAGPLLEAPAVLALVKTAIVEPVPCAVGPACVVLLCAAKVEVTDATTWDTVMVFVTWAVDVRVVVEPDDCATARTGRRRRVEIVGSFISLDFSSYVRQQLKIPVRMID